MSLALHPQTRDVLELAVATSGYQVAVRSDPSLDVWSSVRYPRMGEKICFITYHPSQEKCLDYLVPHECAHIYRFFSANPDKRLLPAVNFSGFEKGKKQAAQECSELRHAVSKDALRQLLDIFCLGLVRQVTNIPADCRIEHWIYENLNSVRDVQASALRELYSTSVRCLAPEIRGSTPRSIYWKSNSMNYVMSKRIADLLNQPDLTAPYVDQGVDEIGEKLNSYLGETDRGYVDDMRIADAWAAELGIERWYRWEKVA